MVRSRSWVQFPPLAPASISMLRNLLKPNPFLVFIVLAVVVAGIFWWQRGAVPPDLQDERGTDEEPVLQEGGDALVPPDLEENTAHKDAIVAILAQASVLLPKGSQGDVERFWFSKNAGVYVEYGTSEGARMAYVVQQRGTWQRAALYGAGESGWEVLEGEDVLFAHPQEELWGYDTRTKQWEQKN